MATLTDLVTPFATVLAVALVARRRAWGVGLRGVLSVVLVYVVTGLDRAFAWWASAGLDFSTHTAFFVAVAGMAVALSWRWLLLYLPLLVVYAWLMDRLGYHPPADVVTSALPAAAWSAACQLAGRRRVASAGS